MNPHFFFRPSPWYDAADADKVIREVESTRRYHSALIANFTPNRTSLRLGVLINGRESSIVVTVADAKAFFSQVSELIEQGNAS